MLSCKKKFNDLSMVLEWIDFYICMYFCFFKMGLLQLAIFSGMSVSIKHKNISTQPATSYRLC